jgi:hypothetical protein
MCGLRMNVHIAALKIIILTGMRKLIMEHRGDLLECFSRKDSRSQGVKDSREITRTLEPSNPRPLFN